MTGRVATGRSREFRNLNKYSEATSATESVVKLPYNLTLRDYQTPAWDYMMQDKPGLRALTVWPRRNGKDLIALNILIAKAAQRPGLYLYIGPFHNQTRQIVWMGATNEGRKFLDFIPSQLITAVRTSVMEIDLFNGGMIKLVGSDHYDSLMGLNCIGAVFTEYSLQRPEAWDYIRPMMTGNGGWALFNGTPRGLNHMYKMARMAAKNDDWFYQYLTRDDTGYPSEEAIEADRRSGMKESLINQEYYCQWEASSDEVFIPLEVVMPTIQDDAEIEPSLYTHAPRILGADVAYSATGDFATLFYRQGRKVHFGRRYKGMDNMAFADEIARFIRQIRPHAVFIDAGRGEGVISRLDRLGFSDVVVPVHFGAKVYVEGIANMKALMWDRMLSWFMSDNKPDMTNLDECSYSNSEIEEDLVTEITTPFMILNEKNEVQVESKKSLKSRGVPSPDLAEGLALTFAEVIEREPINEKLEQMGLDPEDAASIVAQYQQESYDPLTYADSLWNTHS